MLTVTVQPTSTALTTRSAVKTALSITDTTKDAFIDQMLPVVTSVLQSYLNVTPANDGTRSLGLSTFLETLRSHHCRPSLRLARLYVMSVTGVVENGNTLDPSLYELNGPSGLLRRLGFGGNCFIDWPPGKIEVTFTAGWKLPADSVGTALPADIAQAAIELIKSAVHGQSRDPLVKSEEIYQVIRTDYWVGGVGDVAGMSPDTAAKLEPYRDIRV